MTIMTMDDIKKFIPHRYPFLLVDKVIAYEKGKSITAIKNVTCNEPFFNGHFPVKAVMPGVLMVEALAQTAGLLMAKVLNWVEYHDNICYLAGVDKARFKRIVEPGDQLQLHVEMLVNRREIWKFRGKATVGEQLACSTEIIVAR
ncbi:MAG: 3-hydroxyacyl-[acyl-carrier-protein] dehydratase FabZ [Coxiella sp. RIFCSPHIGHO2_12_FULL_42_15]|nr:MAG: 3-hydroxyacyl-[acyl-carrier-protein] dehydratase FabZ [Coxiella sp. RIFCSPHIGHO2_12_FULL_42_15]